VPTGIWTAKRRRRVRRRRRRTALIKSNNPHLAGGEKDQLLPSAVLKAEVFAFVGIACLHFSSKVRGPGEAPQLYMVVHVISNNGT